MFRQSRKSATGQFLYVNSARGNRLLFILFGHYLSPVGRGGERAVEDFKGGSLKNWPKGGSLKSLEGFRGGPLKFAC